MPQLSKVSQNIHSGMHLLTKDISDTDFQAYLSYATKYLTTLANRGSQLSSAEIIEKSIVDGFEFFQDFHDHALDVDVELAMQRTKNAELAKPITKQNP